MFMRLTKISKFTQKLSRTERKKGSDFNYHVFVECCVFVVTLEMDLRFFHLISKIWSSQINSITCSHNALNATHVVEVIKSRTLLLEQASLIWCVVVFCRLVAPVAALLLHRWSSLCFVTDGRTPPCSDITELWGWGWGFVLEPFCTQRSGFADKAGEMCDQFYSQLVNLDGEERNVL